jgi:hypothetical protein
MTFKAAALRYFQDQVPKGYLQRIDRISCFSPLPDYWFWRTRLRIMAKRGVLARRTFGSVWASGANLPSYGLPASLEGNA